MCNFYIIIGAVLMHTVSHVCGSCIVGQCSSDSSAAMQEPQSQAEAILSQLMQMMNQPMNQPVNQPMNQQFANPHMHSPLSGHGDHYTHGQANHHPLGHPLEHNHQQHSHQQHSPMGHHMESNGGHVSMAGHHNPMASMAGDHNPMMGHGTQPHMMGHEKNTGPQANSLATEHGLDLSLGPLDIGDTQPHHLDVAGHAKYMSDEQPVAGTGNTFSLANTLMETAMLNFMQNAHGGETQKMRAVSKHARQLTTGSSRAVAAPYTLYGSAIWQCNAFPVGYPFSSCFWGGTDVMWGVTNAEGVDGGTALAVYYRIQEYTSKPDVNDANGSDSDVEVISRNGISFMSQFAEGGGYTHITFSYEIQFSPNFVFGDGGRLPGVSAGREMCQGEYEGQDCMSSIPAWYSDGYLSLRSYIPAETCTWFCNGGCDYTECHSTKEFVFGKKTAQFIPGQWHTVAQEIKMNTDGNTADGSISLHFDGQRVWFIDGLKLRRNAQLDFDKFLFQAYFESEADEILLSSLEMYTKFRNFQVV